MSAIDAVLFDFGNTLFGHDPLARTIQRCAGELGTPIESAVARSIAADIDAAAHTDAELLLQRDLHRAVWDQRWRILYAIADDRVPGLGPVLMNDMHHPHSWLPFLHTIDTVRELAAAGVAIGVVSNTGWDVRTVFAAHDIDSLIDHFVLSYEVGAVKPDAHVFLDACRRLGVRPAATLMVGDDPRADSGAVAAGLRVLLLPIVEHGADNGIQLAAKLAGATTLRE